MRLAAGGAGNLLHLDAADEKRIGNQGTVTAPGHSFSTHDRSGPLTGDANEIFEGGGKGFGLHVVGIAAEAGVAPGAIDRIAAGMPKTAEIRQMQIPDSCRFERRTQLILSKLGIVAGARDGAHIDELANPMGAEQSDEFVDGPRGVADGEEGQPPRGRAGR